MTAWAALYVYEREAEIRGEGDREFLARVFDRLLTNFTWWVNRKDPDDRNLFQGGFLGLDNIGIFDRSAPLPGGGTLEQADGTAWMALYCQWMLQIAIELVKHDPVYADMALKFAAHFEWISIAMNPPDADTVLWDEEDGFYYDVMRMPDGTAIQLKVRSLVGLLPMCAATVFDGELTERFPMFMERVAEFVRASPTRCRRWRTSRVPTRRAGASSSLVDEPRLRRILSAMLDEDEFLGPHGIRAISRRHLEQPCIFDWGGQEYNVHYLPAESDTGMFGGNSNWRGPVWFPMNVVILRGLAQLHRYYGDELKVECPTGSGHEMNLLEVASRDRHAPGDHVHRGRARTPAGVRRNREVPDRSALARPAAVPRVLPRRQRRRHRRQPPDRLDRHRGAAVHARRRRPALQAGSGRRGGRLSVPAMHLPTRPALDEMNATGRTTRACEDRRAERNHHAPTRHARVHVTLKESPDVC